MLRWNYFADVRPTGQTPLSLVAVTRYRAHAADVTLGQNIAWGTGSDATPGAHRGRMDGLPAAPRDHAQRRIPRRGRGRRRRRVPGFLGSGARGAIYAIEFGVRR